jgi:hypothetical protein
MGCGGLGCAPPFRFGFRFRFWGFGCVPFSSHFDFDI